MTNIAFNDLHGKVCVITGGTGIIGSSMAECLSDNGVKVAILGRNLLSAKILAEKISKKSGVIAIGVEGNVLEKESLEKAKKVINAELGTIDILINGAGGNSSKATTSVERIDETNVHDLSKSFFGLELEGFKDVFDLNFLGTVLPTMIFAKDMIEQRKGVVLNISSMNSFHPLTKISAYSAAKSAVNNFTEWLAVHFAQTGVRVNAIAPGFFITNQNRFLLKDENTGELSARGHKIINSTPMGKFGDPSDLNGALLFLISDSSSFVTGIIIPVDGGFNAYSGV